MPKAFKKCAKEGGRVRAKSLSGGRYQRICYQGGKAHVDYAKKRKKRE